MEEFQFEINYKDINLINQVGDFPKHNNLIYIFHANKIPPHIGWSEENKFYSLKATGTDLGLDTFKINHLIIKKKIPTLIIELNDLEYCERNAHEIFLKYGTGLSKGKTCLNPIDKLLFNEVRHEKIGELLQSLIQNRMKLTFYGANLPTSFQGISNYSRIDIENRIFELQ